MTYVEAISEIQKRSVDALKVVQSTQIASLRATRDLTAAFIAPPMALLGVSPLVSAMANLTKTLTCQVLDGQIACAQTIAQSLAGRRPLTATPNLLALTTAAPPKVLAPGTEPFVTEPLALETLVSEPLVSEPLVSEPLVPTALLDAVAEPESIDEAVLATPTEGAVTSASDRVADELLTSPDELLTSRSEESGGTAEHVELHAAPAVVTVAGTASIEDLDAAPAAHVPVIDAQETHPSSIDAAVEAVIEAAAPIEALSADVLAKALPPPKMSVPRPSVSKKQSGKKAKGPATPNDASRSNRRPGR